tara:strand:+ start:150 stop:662 length:513 start_codon:yes stop_codon:yes gene_type:complete
LSDNFHQKLLNWFCSVTLSIFAASLPPLFFWLIDLPDLVERSISINLVDLAGPFGERFILYAFLLPFFLFWHMFDFAQRGVPMTAVVARLTKYQMFLWPMIAAISLFLLMDLDFLRYNSCDQLNGALFHECYISPSLWLMIPWIIAVGIAVILCAIKAAVSIHSIFKKNQ